MKKKRKIRTELRNGCSRTEVYFSPENYRKLRNNSDLQKDWFVECRFHDPKFKDKYPNGFQFRKRTNCFQTITERKAAMEIYKNDMEILLDKQNYNPITKIFMLSEGFELHRGMDFKSAIEIGMTKLKGSEKHLKDVGVAMRRFCKALDTINYSFLNVENIKIRHILTVFDYLKLTPNYFNKFRQYLSDIFKILIKFDCTDVNPVRDIEKETIEKKFREIISDEELKYVDPFLEKNYYSFYRYRMIFGYSGGRTAEFMRIQKKYVDLEKQEYKVLIKKGKQYTWVTKIIMLDSVPYWKEILEMTDNPDDYIFSVGLVPGPKQIRPYQITKRWERLVKKSEKIKNEKDEVVKVTADFYTLKHKFLDELDKLQDTTPVIPINLAQIVASHKSNATTGIYATGRQSRKNELLKNLRFA